MSASKRFMRELHDVDYQAIVLRRDDGATTGQKFDVLAIEFERLWVEFERRRTDHADGIVTALRACGPPCSKSLAFERFLFDHVSPHDRDAR